MSRRPSAPHPERPILLLHRKQGRGQSGLAQVVRWQGVKSVGTESEHRGGATVAYGHPLGADVARATQQATRRP